MGSTVGDSRHRLLPPQRSATQMLFPSLSTSTALSDPQARPAGSCAQFSTVRYGLGSLLVASVAPLLAARPSRAGFHADGDEHVRPAALEAAAAVARRVVGLQPQDVVPGHAERCRRGRLAVGGIDARLRVLEHDGTRSAKHAPPQRHGRDPAPRPRPVPGATSRALATASLGGSSVANAVSVSGAATAAVRAGGDTRGRTGHRRTVRLQPDDRRRVLRRGIFEGLEHPLRLRVQRDGVGLAVGHQRPRQLLRRRSPRAP